ncbi:PREDICTED: uncharacterized protein LOC108365454 [Rhagoletis zephyria]|uniref:uncharacterized protein LOC108365454 n=1 Tax=Rhagoletis zephyria TaxID=28612 RepID=UPI00081143A7|nr:PREDICTED: uncharacterized protein LOC108365454 [Rhagoletis zephyria]
MNCPICKERIERNSANKIYCCDCKNYFHCKCVNIKAADIEFFKANNKKYRCDKCSAMRRKTLQQPTTILTQIADSLSQQLNTSTASKKQSVSLEHMRTSENKVGHSVSQRSGEQRKAVNVAEQGGNVQLQEQHKATNDNENDKITLQLLYEEIINLKQINIDFLSSIQQLKEENNELRVKVSKLESKLNWREQKLLENSIEIVGVPNVNHENAKECLSKIFSDALNVMVSNDEIEKFNIKRMNLRGYSPSKVSFKNIICVKLASAESKKKIMTAKRTARKNLNTSIFSDVNNKNIYINNCLTNYNKALFLAATKHLIIYNK